MGKTVVSGLLTVGLPGLYWKPVQSGLHKKTDTEFIEKITETDSVLKETYRLNSPLSPHDAADLDGLEINLEYIEASLKSQMRVLLENPEPIPKTLIVEGAGGVFVPLNRKALMIDLIKKLKIPCLIVARSELGTLNHTLLTISVLRANKIPILGVILNGPPSPKNKKSIELYGKVEVLFEISKIDVLTFSNFKKIAKTLPLNNLVRAIKKSDWK